MRHLTFTDGKDYYEQISKVRAEKLYEQGKEIVLCPCKMKPFTEEHAEHRFCKEQFPNDSFYYHFYGVIYYNCNSKNGYYPTFYCKLV